MARHLPGVSGTDRQWKVVGMTSTARGPSEEDKLKLQQRLVGVQRLEILGNSRLGRVQQGLRDCTTLRPA